MCDWVAKQHAAARGSSVWTVAKHIFNAVEIVLENAAGNVKRFRSQAAADLACRGLNMKENSHAHDR